MADIELVVKLPKRVYNYIRKYEHIANTDILDIKDAIVDGMPIPKGHGRLIDENELIDEIEGLPSAQSKQQWIPVSERLPEDNSDILITYVEKDEKRIAPVNYGCGTWFDCLFNKVLDQVGVLAWMPLPEPYEEKKHEID